MARPGPDPCRQPFQVVRLAEHRPQVAAEDRLGEQLLDRVKPLGDQCGGRQRRGQPLGQQPGSHRRHRAINDAEQRAVALGFAEGPDQLEASAGHLVQRQGVGASVGDQSRDVAQRGLLGLAQVGHQRAGCLDVDPAVVDPEPGQSCRAELVVERLARLFGLEIPGGTNRDRAQRLAAEHAYPGRIQAQLRDQHLGRVDPGDLVDQFGPQHARQRESTCR